MHIEVETRVDIHKQEKHQKTFKSEKTNATIHIILYFVNFKQKNY